MTHHHQIQNPHLEQLRVAFSIITYCGILLAIVLVVIGGCLFIWHHGQEYFTSAINHPLPKLLSLHQYWHALKHFSASAIIELGLACLIFTQILRIVATGWLFLKQKDYLFVCFTLFILIVIAISLF